MSHSLFEMICGTILGGHKLARLEYLGKDNDQREIFGGYCIRCKKMFVVDRRALIEGSYDQRR